MKLSRIFKRIVRFFNGKSKKEKKLLHLIGGICMHEFYSSRNLRRKIKGTRLEYLLIEILINQNNSR